MNAQECNRRACDCAANAAMAVDEAVSFEFLRMAGQWRAMAVSEAFIGRATAPLKGRNHADAASSRHG